MKMSFVDKAKLLSILIKWDVLVEVNLQIFKKLKMRNPLKISLEVL